MPFYPSEIKYSDKYFATDFEYTSVILPKRLLGKVCEKKLLSHDQLKNIGVEINSDWENYAVHDPEPHVILLRRKITEKERKRLYGK